MRTVVGRFGGAILNLGSPKRRPMQFRPTMWLDAEQVLVTVIVDVQSPADFNIAETLVPLAFQRAATWIERNGVTHPYMTYRIKGGKLNNIPTLSAEEPPAD